MQLLLKSLLGLKNIIYGCPKSFAGPMSVFSAANKYLPANEGYNISTAALELGMLKMNSPINIVADQTLDSVVPEKIHTLLLCGGMPGTHNIKKNTDLNKLILETNRLKKRVGAICTGAFILAESGILKGRKCTTHWQYLNELELYYKNLIVLNDVLYCNDNNIWTSAGVTAGMDMSLAMVSEDFGSHIAGKVAKDLDMHIVRSGSSKQLSYHLFLPETSHQKFKDLIKWVYSKPSINHSSTSLASRCNMSLRNFTRKFRSETNLTPSQLIKNSRISAVKYFLSESDYDLQVIANHSGFSSAETMKNNFRKCVNMSPQQYRTMMMMENQIKLSPKLMHQELGHDHPRREVLNHL